MNKKRILLSLVLILSLTFAVSGMAFATSTIGEEKEAEYSLNNIMFYQQCPTTTSGGSSEVCGSNENYAGEQVFNEKQMETINHHQPIYEKAASQYGFPWQILAVLHYREWGLQQSNPPNGQGIYQLYSYTSGGQNGNAFKPAGKVSDEEFQRQTDIVAKLINENYGKGLDLGTDEGVKQLFFNYNGAGDGAVFEKKAKALGFDNPAEGSAYVMNKYDEKRDPKSPNVSPAWIGNYTADGKWSATAKDERWGTFTAYKAITCDGSMVNPDDSAAVPDDDAAEAPSSQPSATVSSSSSNASANAEKIAKTALDLAWPNDAKPSDYNKKKGGKPTEAMEKAWESLGTTEENKSHGPDCGYFVQTVIGYSNVDPNYSNKKATLGIESYSKKNPDKWEVIDFKDGDTSKLQSGDIIIGHGGGGGTGNHALIVADIDGKLWKVEAGYTSKRWGRVSDPIGKKYKHYDKQIIIRAKGGSSAPSCDPFNSGSMNINATGAALAWPLDTPEEKYTLARGKVLESALTSPGQTVDFPGTGSGNAAFQKAWVETKMSENSGNDDTLDNTGIYSWRYGAYCCGFTATVIRYSGYDPHFSGSLSVGGFEQVNYARNHSDLWEVIEWDHQKSSLKGGDVFNSSTHSWMVVEDASGELYIAEASLHGHTFGHIAKYDGTGGKVYIIRATHASNSNTGVSVTGNMQTASSAKTGSATIAGKGNGNIGASAIELAWPEGTSEDVYQKKATDKFTKYFESLPQAAQDKQQAKTAKCDYSGGKSCDRFVATAVRHSGVDPDFDFGPVDSGTLPYLESNPNWEEVQMNDTKSTEEYKSGDVLIFYGANGPSHTGIYAVDSNGKGHLVQASYCTEFGVVKPATNIASSTWTKIRVFRNKNNNSGSNATGCNVCGGVGGSDSGDGTLQDGGFTSVEEAEKVVMTEYRGLWDNNGEARSKYLINAGCKGHLINNCPSFVRYFVNKYANKKWTDGPTGHGKDVAGNVAKFYGLSTSKTPSAYSVFSVPEGVTICPGGIPCGHTGIVLGVDTARKKVIIGEAGCGSGLDFIHAKEKDLSTFTSGKYTFTNLNSVLKTGGLSDV